MLSERDRRRLQGLHPDLHRVVTAMGGFCPMPFMVLEGLRTVEQQADYVADGKSTTMNSRHLDGHAVDLAPLVNGQPSWDWPLYDQFAVHMKGAGNMCGVPLEWGGDWKTFKDGPHWQLPWDAYPSPAGKEPGVEEVRSAEA
jgi:peptidoglycan L-alanyl-D-glutamate endopeptidase CwlK